ncbi:MAG: hypothetical protein ACRDXB_02215, partial [Actinomycetes bacterium]
MVPERSVDELLSALRARLRAEHRLLVGYSGGVDSALVAAVAALNLTVSWGMIVSLVPSLRLREAAVLNLGPTAVA